jgi:hypothetical protein
MHVMAKKVKAEGGPPERITASIAEQELAGVFQEFPPVIVFGNIAAAKDHLGFEGEELVIAGVPPGRIPQKLEIQEPIIANFDPPGIAMRLKGHF